MNKSKTANRIALQLRETYCLAGAQFCAKDLEAGWKEIERLEQALADVKRHQKIVSGGLYKQTGAWNIANEALKVNEI